MKVEEGWRSLLTRSSNLSDVEFLRSVMPATTDPTFFQFLLQLDCSKVTVRSVPEGSVVFARVSFRAEGQGSHTHRRSL